MYWRAFQTTITITCSYTKNLTTRSTSIQLYKNRWWPWPGKYTKVLQCRNKYLLYASKFLWVWNANEHAENTTTEICVCCVQVYILHIVHIYLHSPIYITSAKQQANGWSWDGESKQHAEKQRSAKSEPLSFLDEWRTYACRGRKLTCFLMMFCLANFGRLDFLPYDSKRPA